MTPPDRARLDPALVARFRRSVERLRLIADGERIALAVSGGPDSMALLTLAAAAYPGQVLAATVDHGLRAEAADEATMVADYAASIGVAHATLRIAAPPAAHDNVQAWARAHRYDLLTRWAMTAGATCLATAHHADDQAETFLMRAARGSGVAGLAGIRAHRPASAEAPVALIRPLLDWRVGELRALVEALGVPFVDDPSNADPRYDRTQARALLREAPWLDPVQVARSAAYAAEADAALHAIEAWLWATRTRSIPEVEVRLDIADLPRELRRRLARRAIQAVRSRAGVTRPAFTDSTNIESLLDALQAGKTVTQGGVIADARANVWHFREEPPRRSL